MNEKDNVIEHSACDTCKWYNSGIPCGVEPSVCKREVTVTPQTETDFWSSVTREDWLKAHGLDGGADNE